jgi:malonyl CoA-acyl carrier protein transacylase
VQSLHLTIVTGNPETLDGLELYVRRAGASANGTRRISELVEMTPALASAVVLFPDDYEWEAVLSALEQVRTERPRVLLVVITSAARRFELLPLLGGAIPPLVIPKPVWGWRILDSIRARIANPEASLSE